MNRHEHAAPVMRDELAAVQRIRQYVGFQSFERRSFLGDPFEQPIDTDLAVDVAHADSASKAIDPADAVESPHAPRYALNAFEYVRK